MSDSIQTPSATTDMLAAPGAASAYGQIIRRTENPREIEYRVFAQATAALEAAAAPGAGPTDRISALHGNRELWTTLACDLVAETNGLPEALRANLLSLAIWVNGETTRALREGAPLQDLVETNRAMMLGLCPSVQSTAEQG
jgi:flagellar protein FlaF